jgi:hypothetical protein
VAKRTALLTLPRQRIVNDAQLAAYIGKSVSWLTEHRRELEARGFPPRLPIVGGNDLDKVDVWLDQLLDPNAAAYERDFEQAWLEAAKA